MNNFQAVSLPVFSPKTHLAGGRIYPEVNLPNLPLFGHPPPTVEKEYPPLSLLESELWALLQGQTLPGGNQ